MICFKIVYICIQHGTGNKYSYRFSEWPIELLVIPPYHVGQSDKAIKAKYYDIIKKCTVRIKYCSKRNEQEPTLMSIDIEILIRERPLISKVKLLDFAAVMGILCPLWEVI